MDIATLREYLHSIKDDWNYITPIDFYNRYYLHLLSFQTPKIQFLFIF
jgi:hypothetical protein